MLASSGVAAPSRAVQRWKRDRYHQPAARCMVPPSCWVHCEGFLASCLGTCDAQALHQLHTGSQVHQPASKTLARALLQQHGLAIPVLAAALATGLPWARSSDLS